MKSYKLLLFIPLFFIFSKSFAQEGNNWFITADFLVNFNCAPPTTSLTFPPASAETNGGEPCTSMSDTQGNLIFYTTSRSIYNRQNKIMTHGKDSLQQFTGYVFYNSIFCTPDPANKNKYYVFFIDLYDNKQWDPFDLNYAIVDMSLNNGLGDVVSVKRHIITHVQGITGTRHKNKRDYWLATFQRSDVHTSKGTYIDSVVVFNLNPAGLKYHKISVNTEFKGEAHVNFSPDGKRMALYEWANATNTFFKLYNFDKNTGFVSKPIHIKGISELEAVEFSPDNTKMYGFSADQNYFYLH